MFARPKEIRRIQKERHLDFADHNDSLRKACQAKKRRIQKRSHLDPADHNDSLAKNRQPVFGGALTGNPAEDLGKIVGVRIAYGPADFFHIDGGLL